MPKQDNLKVISAKDLGKLALPDFCARCFWLERHSGKPPSLFPSIFSVIDSLTKKNVHRSFLEKGKPPVWFPEFAEIEEICQGEVSFKLWVEAGDWILAGKPDDIFRLKDGTYHIVDYKTAKFTGRQDELFPLYEVQLNVYAFLAERCGFKPVSGLSLVYFEPEESTTEEEEFGLIFKTHCLKVNLKSEVVVELLKKAREIVQAPDLPESAFGCQGLCRWLDRGLSHFKTPGD
ncbi:MAG: hypothetical protein A2117_02040 [Candidatus Wildermuthbacteria bacterium GWA2_46_15]|uniref:PD-(D/E)XK endonuclease-like domain-containing protein n=1 Tax=Candidatus Wildermuthbacteria bacterium GWA2_46_15 TaxID=1802443 RepID=A0A1G2QNU4_9BACT|nr:MAG: hypothetical protein A2117_02040 [Candidatus Wildermuthbacteria bacterium GWA2_46_15]